MLKKLILPKKQSWQMFNEIAPRYDFLNRVLSLGLDVRWRMKMIKLLPVQKDLHVLDLATGTADVAITLVKHCSTISKVIGVDPAKGMLDIGRAKIAKAGLQNSIQLQEGDAQNLPFEDNTFDVITISFGIRNVPNLTKGLLEMHRVLKPGGRVLILEFSMPKNSVLKFGHIVYLRTVVPIIGFLLSGHYKAYKYLNQTIESFPYGEQFGRILKQTGFINTQQHLLLNGVATIYESYKKNK